MLEKLEKKKYFLLVDESGDPGLGKIRTMDSGGASDYFVMGAAVFPATSIGGIKKMISDFREKTEISDKKWDHATNLSHSQEVLLSRMTSGIDAKFFSVISKKSTLGRYKDFIDGDPVKFYNKCTSYLLEKCCKYLQDLGADSSSVEIIFEKRNHDYDRMRRYLAAIVRKPFHEDSKSLSVIDPYAITVKTKKEEPLLRIADIVAHATFSCVNKTPKNFGIPEYRYLQEIANNFGSDHKGSVLNHGIKCIHSVDDIDLDPDVSEVFARLNGIPAQQSVA